MRRGFGVALCGAIAVSATAARAADPALTAIALAKKGECDSAIPLLEEAENVAHRPSTAAALAGCYATTGELLTASDLFHAIGAEAPQRTWSAADRAAAKQAAARAAEIDARIPTVSIDLAARYEGLEVVVDGQLVLDVSAPVRVKPDVPVTVVASARGRVETRLVVTLSEGARERVRIDLAKRRGSAQGTTSSGARRSWLGARLQGFVVPKLAWQLFGTGGRTAFAPGGGLTFTTPAGHADLDFFVGYASYRLGDTPFKPSGGAVTDWEIVDSTLQSLYSTASVSWSVPLDARARWAFRFGLGIGLGWTFAGDLHRTQAYPPKSATSIDDFVKCKAPNDPPGSFAYCNQLDRDANHYGNYAEPDWFHHGHRPLVYPLVTLPEAGFSYEGDEVACDVRASLGLSGIGVALGVRHAF